MAEEKLTLSVILRADGAGLKGEVRASAAELDKLRGTTGKVTPQLTKLESAAIKVRGAFAGIKSEVFSLKTALTTGGFALFARQLFQAGVEEEQFARGMASATGSAEAAGRELAFVTSEAERLGFNNDIATRSYIDLAAAARGTALEGQGTRDIFRGVIETTRALGKETGDTTRALDAIGRMMNKGEVDSRGLRVMLADSLPGAFKIAAEAMHVTEDALGKMIEKGDLLAEDLLPVLAKALHEKFGKAAEDAAQGAEANFHRMANAWDDLKDAIAEGAALQAMSAVFKFLAEQIRKSGMFGVELAATYDRVMLLIENRTAAAAQFFTLAWHGATNTVKGYWADWTDLVAKGLEFTGADTLAASMRDYAASIKPATSATDEYNAAIAKGNKEYQAKLALHDKIFDEMRNEAKAAYELGHEVLPPLNTATNKNAHETAAAAAAHKKLAEEIKTSRKTLKGMAEELGMQGATFGQTEPMVLRYRLTVGDLADDIKRLGVEGEKTRDSLIKMADDVAAKQLLGETLTDMDKLTAKMQEADRLFAAGAFGEGDAALEKYSQVIFGIETEMDGLGKKTKETGDVMTEFAKAAAANVQSAFADFLFDPFNSDLRGLLLNFSDTMRRIAAEALAQAILTKAYTAATSAAVVSNKAAETTAVVTMDAAQAGAEAAKSQAGTPVIGPALALTAMAVVVASVLGLLAMSKFAKGGLVKGPGGIDTIPAMLTKDEYVLNTAAVRNIGVNNLDKLNAGKAPRLFGAGGFVGTQGAARIVAKSDGELYADNDPRGARGRPMGANSQAQPQNVRMVLVDDRANIGDYLASSDGERVIMQTLRRNSMAIRQSLG